MPPSLTPRLLPVFLCYARQDNESADPSKRWLDRLLQHLHPLVAESQVGAWSDREIEAGSDWKEAIGQSLKAARAAVLLVSPAFLASNYIRNSELPVLIRRQRDEGLLVLPLILKPCLFEESLFRYPDPVHGPEEFSLASLQAVNSPNKALSGLSEHEQDEVLVKLAKRLLQQVRGAEARVKPAPASEPVVVAPPPMQQWRGTEAPVKPAPAPEPVVVVAPPPAIVAASKLRPRMVRIEAGEFLMGSPESEEGRSKDEVRHRVRISRPFSMSVTQVTQGQYQAVMGKNPSHFTGNPDLPVESVSWLDAVAYCNRLSEMEGLSACYGVSGEKVTWQEGLRATGYRLPTEAEWEYAARAGQDLLYAGSTDPDEVAWFAANADRMTHPVGQKKANAWGLHDMSGNVWEWVWDWYGAYSVEESVDPIGPNSGSSRVNRGGSWDSVPISLRVAGRDRDSSGFALVYLGFRLSRSLP